VVREREREGRKRGVHGKKCMRDAKEGGRATEGERKKRELEATGC
jgi:hypothetical protein